MCIWGSIWTPSCLPQQQDIINYQSYARTVKLGQLIGDDGILDYLLAKKQCDGSINFLQHSFGYELKKKPEIGHLILIRCILNFRPSSPEVIKLFPCSTQLSTKFILLINVKMPTIVGILKFISMINTTSERLKARNFLICPNFSFYEQLKFRVQLS